MQNEILCYEELSMNAQPCFQTQLYDGWVLRFANGYTNRANSINPLYPSEQSASEKIEHCEQVYARKGLPSVFKLTPRSPAGLDGLLDRRGYELATPTDLMTSELNEINIDGFKTVVTSYIDPMWIRSFTALSGVSKPTDKQSARTMLEHIQNRVLCGTIALKGQVVACGLCVIERGYAGLFDIIVHSHYRGRGFGHDICASLLANSWMLGAKTGYLQVMASNKPAVSLYQKLGFSSKYQYWYRIK